MKFAPASADASFSGRPTIATAPSNHRAETRRMFLQAATLGLCAGLVIIGLIENTQRFADPGDLADHLRNERLAADENKTGQSSTLALRADRLDQAN